MTTTTTPQPGDTIYAQWVVGPAQRGSGWIDARHMTEPAAYIVGEPLGSTMTVKIGLGHATIYQGQYLTEEDLRAAEVAQWNADPSIPESEKFHDVEVYDDEPEHLSHAALAAECAMLRDFNYYSSPASLQADYEKHGNAWPFSGDHLGAQHVREDVYTPGVGHEPGDVIGRVRVRTAQGVLWAQIGA